MNKYRPATFDDYVGQTKVKSDILINIKAAKIENKNLGHILFTGASGYGKTSLAYLIAKEFNSKIHVINGANLQKIADISSILININNDNNIIFIDEIHAISKEVQELLLSIMEDKILNVTIGQDYNSKIVTLNLPDFTLIGASTMLHNINKPLLNRFSNIYFLKKYNHQQISLIISNIFKHKKIKISYEICELLASYSRLNPRYSIHLAEKIYNYGLVKYDLKFDQKIVKMILKEIECNLYGLNSIELLYLFKISDKIKATSIQAISQILNMPLATVVNNIEPYLLQLNLINTTNQGRIITEYGKEIIKQIKNNI